MKIMWVVWSLVATILFIHKTRRGSEPHQTLVMCLLCRYCFSPSPRIHYKTVVSLPCPVH